MVFKGQSVSRSLSPPFDANGLNCRAQLAPPAPKSPTGRCALDENLCTAASPLRLARLVATRAIADRTASCGGKASAGVATEG